MEELLQANEEKKLKEVSKRQYEDWKEISLEASDRDILEAGSKTSKRGLFFKKQGSDRGVVFGNKRR